MHTIPVLRVTQCKHTPKLLAQLAAMQEELKWPRTRIEHGGGGKTCCASRSRKKELQGRPHTRNGTFVNGAAFSSLEGFLDRARESEEDKARKDAENLKKAASRKKPHDYPLFST
jgi:hypothetical protein